MKTSNFTTGKKDGENLINERKHTVSASELTGLVMSEFTGKLTTGLASTKEGLIKAAITHQIGTYQWTISDITGRGEFKILPDKTEIFAFDGVDLIHFGHMRTEVDNGKTGLYMRATQEYQLLYS